VSDTA